MRRGTHICSIGQGNSQGSTEIDTDDGLGLGTSVSGLNRGNDPLSSANVIDVSRDRSILVVAIDDTYGRISQRQSLGGT